MAGFGLPNITSPASVLSGAGVTNTNPRDLSAPEVLKMAIIPVNEPYSPNNTLLLNTNSITESKSANWVKHYVPGQSDPLMQWISGTEKTISFSALVTKDIASNPTVNKDDNGTQWELVIQPELYERYANADDVPASILDSVNTNQVTAFLSESVSITKPVRPYWTRSIQPQLDFYRSLVIPREGSSSSLSDTPPLVHLRMGTILGERASIESQQYILLNYNMNITEYSPELEPTKAIVSFTFVEYVPRSKTSAAQTSSNTEATQAIRDNANSRFTNTLATGISGIEA